MRKFLIGLVVLAAVLVAVAFVGPQFVPTDSIKRDIAAEVRKATGRTLSIDGGLSFRILPAPGVSADNLRLSNVEGGSAADMVRLRSAAVEVALFPLLSGNIQVSRIVLGQPQIVLEQFADGSNNWTFEPQGEPVGGGAPGAQSPDGSAGPPPVRFDNVEIRGGSVELRTPDGVRRVEDLQMVLGAESLQGPFRAVGSLRAEGIALELDGAVGALVEEKATPVNVRLSTGGAKLSYSGVLSGAPEAIRASGQLELDAADLSGLFASLSGAPAPAVLRGKELELEGSLAASADAIAVNDLSIRLGEDSATGAIQVSLGDVPDAALVLNVRQLDLDRLLAETTAPAGAAATSGSGNTKPLNPPSGRTPSGGVAGFALPTGISASLEAKIDALRWRQGVVQQILLNAQLADGTLNISQAAAQLPGSGSASVIGFVAAQDGVPAFEGQAELSADDFRALLQWVGADVQSVPRGRLSRMAGSLTVQATPENVTLTDIDVSVDASRLRGGVAIALRERPGFGIGLSLDKVNVDAYLPANDNASSARPSAGPVQKPATRTPEGAPGSGAAGGLAALDTFDAILQFKVGELTYREQTVRGVNIDGTLQAGALELRDASVESLAGAKASVSGRLDGLSSAPRADLSVDLQTDDADRMLALAGVTPPARIGAGKLSGQFRGDLQSLDIDAGLDALGANLTAKGKLGVLANPPGYDLDIGLAHPDAAAFFARLQGSRAGDLPDAGPLSARIGASGDLARTNLDANVGIGDGRIAMVGELSNLAAGAPSGAVTLDASHPDMVAFVRTFAPDYRPSLSDAGPFSLASRLAVAPDSYRLESLEGQAGPVSYKGNANVALGGARPDLTAQLETSEIVVDWFLPAGSGGGASSSSGGRSSGAGAPAAGGAGSGGSGPGGERWSRDPLDLSVLQTLDADVKLSAPAIAYTNIRVDQPRLAIRLENGVLDLNELSGNAFGGGFGMTGQLAAGDVPSMRYTMRVDGADAAGFLAGSGSGDRGVMSALDLLFPVSSVKLVSGTLGAELDVSSQGRSEFAMISNLAGKGAMRFTDAVVDGIDVCRISDQLDRLNGIEGFLGLALSAKGGQTRVANFDGRFDIKDGIAILPQQQINADCAAVAFAGTTNLPGWLVDIRARAGFPAHNDFPAVVIEQKGPLDAPNTRLVNVNEINQYIVGKAAGSVLRRFLPGGSQQQQAPSDSGGSSGQTQPQQQQQQPADQFRNLLEGLIRGR